MVDQNVVVSGAWSYAWSCGGPWRSSDLSDIRKRAGLKCLRVWESTDGKVLCWKILQIFCYYLEAWIGVFGWAYACEKKNGPQNYWMLACSSTQSLTAADLSSSGIFLTSHTLQLAPILPQYLMGGYTSSLMIVWPSILCSTLER